MWICKNILENLESVVIARSGLNKIQLERPLLERMRDDEKMPPAMRLKLSEDIEVLEIIKKELIDFLDPNS